MEFWDKFKKGAQEMGEKAAQLGKIAKLQTEITGINASKGGKLADLGRNVYALYKDGKLPDELKEMLQNFIAPIEEGEKRVEDKEKEIALIKREMQETKETGKEEQPEVKEAEAVKTEKEAPAEKPEEKIPEVKETKKEQTKKEKREGN